MKSHRLFGSVLIFCVFFLSSGPCHAQRYSPGFQALLNQIQQNYLAPKGENLSFLESRFPAVVAALIGHGLRQQMVHVQKNPSLNNQFNSLKQDARTYIADVARTTSFIPENGNRFTTEDLWNIVNKVLKGLDDAWIFQNFGVRTGTMPSVLVASSRPQPPERPPGSLNEKDEKNQIDLFGNVAPPVKGGPDNCDNVAFYFSPQCKEYRQQKEAQAAAEKNRSKALNPDGITGTWFARQRKTQLSIRKQGDVYLGSSSGETNGDYNFRPNTVCLRLKYAGAGKEGPIYKGQYYGSSGAAGDYSWQDITFYYYISWGKEVFSSGTSSSPGVKNFGR